MRGDIEIDWRRLADGTLSYEMAWPAMDGDRFDRIARGFSDHYELEWRSPDAFAFGRGEGYTRLERWDAFGYVDRGTVERLRAESAEIEGGGDNVVLLPAGYRGIRFTLNMRVILVFWIALLLVAHFVLFDSVPIWAWVGGFLFIYVAHIALVVASLSRKLAHWLARESWN